jgi:sugar transferase (PEP-CTERM/EpsH1 system associated)
MPESDMPTPAAFREHPPPLVLHVVYRFDTGGLENGVVNLINHMPAAAYRHALLALTEVSPTFSQRIQTPGVGLHALHKRPGHGFWLYPALYRLFRALRPAVVHTRNLAALECQVPAWAAGVPARVHGEHGRDVADPDGNNRAHQLARRLYKPFVHHQLALSQDLAGYLRQRIGLADAALTLACNGVDAQRFHPPADGRRATLAGSPFQDPALWLVGTVGRMQAIKDPTLLVRAFLRALELQPALRARLRLVLVGDGPLRAELQARCPGVVLTGQRGGVDLGAHYA